jgi:hypothetical protein
VVRIESEQNLEILRQVALLLHRENQHLHDRLQKLTAEKLRLQGADADQLQLEIDQLRELLARREREIFGASSEKRPRAKAEESSEPTPRNGHGPREQPSLPTLEAIHELPADQRACPQCGGSLVEMGDQACHRSSNFPPFRSLSVPPFPTGEGAGAVVAYGPCRCCGKSRKRLSHSTLDGVDDTPPTGPTGPAAVPQPRFEGGTVDDRQGGNSGDR